MTEDDRAAVRRTYDRIADHFAKTRAYPWPEIEEFLVAAPDCALGLDVGCGNARHVLAMADRADRLLGVDLSRGLLATARERTAESGVDPDRVAFCQGDAARLPVATGVAGLAVYVATLHHLPDRTTRRRSLDELARVLAPDGAGLVSAWSVTHDRFDRTEGFDTEVDWTLPGGETVPRFYHVYDPGEFRADLDASDLVVDETFTASGNCYAHVRGAIPTS